jgi:hypothetical protein
MQSTPSYQDPLAQLWNDFLALYFRFYEVIIFEDTYVIGEGKMKNVFLDIKLRL